MTIFKSIIDKTIPADVVYEDDEVLAFKDINPVAPVHILIIPKVEITGAAAVQSEDSALLGKLIVTAAKVAEDVGIAASGYRLVVNQGGDGGQTVNHLHVHLIGGRALRWPPG